MNDFFFNLVGRHLPAYDTITPRIMGRFEEDRGGRSSASPLEGPNSLESDGKSTSTLHESDLSGPEKGHSSSHKGQRNPLVQRRSSDQQEIPAHSPPLSGRTNTISPPDEMAADTLPPNSRVDEHDLTDEIDHRITTMLQFLPGNAEPSAPGHPPDTFNSRISQAPDNNTSWQNSVVVSLGKVPTLEQQTETPKSIFIDKGADNKALSKPLSAPPWFPEIEGRFNTKIKDKGVATEPVINVTIGRVEVHAVKGDTAGKTGRSKKPTGVMPLDEYLAKRENRGAR